MGAGSPAVGAGRLMGAQAGEKRKVWLLPGAERVQEEAGGSLGELPLHTSPLTT